MKMTLTRSMRQYIADVIGVILREVDLRGGRITDDTIHVQIVSGKFEHSQDIGRIINKINEGETTGVLRVFSERQFREKLDDHKITEAAVSRLLRLRSIFDLDPDLLGQEEKLEFLIFDLGKLKSIHGRLQKVTTRTGGMKEISLRLSPESAASLSKRLIRKDGAGDYFYNGMVLKLSKANIAYDILDILYSRFPIGGFLPYSDIGKELKKRGKGGGSIKSIQNAVGNHQGLFGIATVGGKKLSRQTPDGKELVKIVRGKGLQFNNPEI